MKKLRLHHSALSKEAITAIAADTLQAGGFDPPRMPAKSPEIDAVIPPHVRNRWSETI